MKTKVVAQDEEASTHDDLHKTNKFIKLFQFLSWLLGVFPVKQNKLAGTLSFKLFSTTSFFALIRLLIFNLPFSAPSLVFAYSGLSHSERENYMVKNNITVKNTELTSSENGKPLIVGLFDYYITYLYYILPFTFAHAMTGPINQLNEIFKQAFQEGKEHFSVSLSSRRSGKMPNTSIFTNELFCFDQF